MNSQIKVEIESDWKQADPSLPIAIATLRITLPQLTLRTDTPLTKDQVEAFLAFNEELLGRRVKKRLARLYPDLRTKVFCSGLKAGSLEFLFNIDVSTLLVYGGTAVTFIANYPKLKKGIKEIISDVQKMGSWLTQACADTFDWITVGHSEGQENEQSSDGGRATLVEEVIRAAEKLRRHDEKEEE